MTEPRQLELPFGCPDPESEAVRRERVAALTADLVERARSRWPDAGIPDVRIDFGIRGHAAGDACVQSATVRYNAGLLDRYDEEFIRTIVPHEVAHVVVGRVFGRVKPHGPEWRSVMEFFGAPPSVTHGFETTPARRTRRFRYRCACPEPHQVAARTHRRIRRGYLELRCRRCGEPLHQVEP